MFEERQQVLEERRIESGWPTDDYGMVLYSMVRALRPEVVVEIGPYKGFSTLCMAKGLMENGGGLIYTVDKKRWLNLDDLPGSLQAYINYFVMNSASEGFQKLVDSVGWIDLAFIDGDHSYGACKRDFETLYPRILEGGIIAFHDADRATIRRVLAEARLNQKMSVIMLPVFGGMAIAQKQGYNPVKNLEFWGIER